MNKIIIASSLFIMGILNISCISFGESIKPSKNYITREYKVSDFDKIEISTVADVYFIQSTDSTTSAQVYGPDNIVEMIKVDIQDNTLMMSMNKKKMHNVKKMKITISAPELRQIIFKGVGSFLIEDGLKTADLNVVCEGVGDVRISQLVCEGDLSVRSLGVGNVKLNGKATNATLSSKGVGNIEADKLECVEVKATSEGVGNISCFASQSIDASVKGIGNISYQGNPTNKVLNKSGIGSIKQKD